MAEEREVGVAGTEVTGDAEIHGGREQGARARGSATDPDAGGGAGRPSQGGSGEPAFTQGETPSDAELDDPEVGGTAGGGPAGA